MEMASARRCRICPRLGDVGSEVNVRHLAPTPVGRTVVATARVVEVSGRSLLFAVEAHDGVRKIGEGTTAAARSTWRASPSGSPPVETRRGAAGEGRGGPCWSGCRMRRRRPLRCAPAARSWLRTSRRRSARPWGGATGLVIVIDPDFDGDFAELARGLASAALAHKSLVKLAVVIDPEQMDGARLNSFEASPVPDPPVRPRRRERRARMGGGGPARGVAAGLRR